MAKLDMTALVPAGKAEVEVLPPEKVDVLPAVSADMNLASNSGGGFTKFATAAVSMPFALASELLSTVNHLINAYEEIQKSHDQVKIVQAQAKAYIRGKQEDTRQVAIQQENETIRFLARCRADLEIQRNEYKKFTEELSERRKARQDEQRQWRQSVEPLLKYTQLLMERSKQAWDEYVAGGFESETLRDELRIADAQLNSCLDKICNLKAGG